jgi:hypothetical protein
MRSVRSGTHMGDMRNAYKILVGKPQGKNRLGISNVGEGLVIKWTI